MYHPVVLFKFSTKRGASPLLSASRPQRLLLEAGKEKARRAERHQASPPLSQSERPGQEGWEEGSSVWPECTKPAAQPLFTGTDSVRRGSLGGALARRERTVVGAEPKDAPTGTKGFFLNFWISISSITRKHQQEERKRSRCLPSNRRGSFFKRNIRGKPLCILKLQSWTFFPSIHDYTGAEIAFSHRTLNWNEVHFSCLIPLLFRLLWGTLKVRSSGESKEMTFYFIDAMAIQPS